TQKDFTQELKNLIHEKNPEKLHETITFYRNKDFTKFIEIKERLTKFVLSGETFEKAYEKARNSLKTQRSKLLENWLFFGPYVFTSFFENYRKNPSVKSPLVIDIEVTIVCNLSYF
ncbi:hypothetical protein BpHYR1_007314, partial [Brachionus plicatilis]